ncbi:large ribosomal subunit protein bL35m [Maniola hyperantus]|uniref:large ribosomal subunit protein bL35m n=1 Tax=Aphantopus hyperantus TaxID=2795564 RepID=UPI00156A2B1B|nr:39S ribosomal protein L35, mitochondrial [Maniola hyperantus]
MFRCALTAIRTIRPILFQNYAARILYDQPRTFSALNTRINSNVYTGCTDSNLSLVNNKQVLDVSNNIIIPTRAVTKFSLKKGKRKTVKAVVKRFFRLHWGAWIRTKIGRHKKLWKKSQAQKRRLRQHVFVNSTQTVLLDKMVTKYWKRPKYYVDDPYEPYHTREEYHITRRKPRETY